MAIKKPKAKAKRLMLDGDLICWRTSASKEHPIDWGGGLWTLHSDANECYLSATQYIDSIKDMTGIDDVVIAHSHPVNFRKELFPEYKGNRVEVRKPLAFRALKQWLMNEYERAILQRVEADDVMGLAADEVIMVSDDKDMMTVPSVHFDPATRQLIEIDLAQANFNFYCQTLSGDTTDNYKGVPNVGTKTAQKILNGIDPVKEERKMWEVVVATYLKAGLTEEDALMNARMARILRAGEYDIEAQRPILWTPPAT